MTNPEGSRTPGIRAEIGDAAIQAAGLISDAQVREMLGLRSESAVRTRMARGTLPPPAAFARGYYWRREDIEAVLAPGTDDS